MEDSTQVLRLSDADIVWRSVENEIVILHRGDWQYLTVNEAGALLWARLAQGTTRDELASLLGAEYGIDESRARDDVDAFLELLAESGLLAFGEVNQR
jgi:hypothetical protein